jgi:hypothetical protein
MARRLQDRTTGPYLRWSVVEDAATLDGATKEQVRDKHIEWRNGLSVERDGPGADHPITKLLPRFEYAIHVGRDSLDSLIAHEAAGGVARFSPIYFTLVRAPQPLLSHDDEDDEDEEDLSDGYDVEWMYVDTNLWIEIYEELHGDSGWQHNYARPPKVCPH